MYDHTLHRGTTHSCCYCVLDFITKEILKCPTKECFKINAKQRIKLPKKYAYTKFKHDGRKINSSFIMYSDYESTLVAEHNEIKNQKDSTGKKYQTNTSSTILQKWVSVDVSLVSLLRHIYEKLKFTDFLILW